MLCSGIGEALHLGDRLGIVDVAAAVKMAKAGGKMSVANSLCAALCAKYITFYKCLAPRLGVDPTDEKALLRMAIQLKEDEKLRVDVLKDVVAEAAMSDLETADGAAAGLFLSTPIMLVLDDAHDMTKDAGLVALLELGIVTEGSVVMLSPQLAPV